MDHTGLPSDPSYPPLCIPCLSQLPCTDADFDTYPAQRGWDLSRLLAGDFAQHPSSETAAFLQDWLYFVLLRTVLGEIAEKRLYVAPQPGQYYGRVTTCHLKAHVHHRMAAVKNLARSGRPDAVLNVVEKVESCLMRLSHFCQLARTCEWPLPPEVDLSVRAVGLYLSSAFYEGLWALYPQVRHSVLPLLRFGSAPVLEAQMLKMGWCPSDVSMVLDQFSPSSAYYASMLKRAPVPGDHRTCTGPKCLAFQTNEETYETKHVSDGCCCSYVGPAAVDLVNVIKSGGTPLLTIVVDAKSGTASLRVAPHKPGQRYVCFSHVWSHGLGNPRENQLPLCQILRFKALLDELFDLESSLGHFNKGHFADLFKRRRNVSTPFWIDSLCIPVRGEHSAVRTQAVSRIRDVFRDAHQVLVLDAELQGTDLTDVYEGFMMLSLSQWMRRLWTLLEGTLGSRVHVKFKDCIINLDDSYQQLLSSKGTQGEVDAAEEFFGSLSADASMFYWKMRSLRVTLVDQTERKMVGLSTKISFHDPESGVIRKRCVGIMEAFVASRYRTTSWIEDVYPCLANLLGWEVSNLSSVPVEDRMRLLFQSQTVLPQGILFVQGPRMTEHGWRWAVTGFDDARMSQGQASIRDFTPARRDEMGFTVIYPGLVLPGKLTLDKHEEILVSTASETEQCVFWWRITLIGEMTPARGRGEDMVRSEQSGYAGVFPTSGLVVIFYRTERSLLPGISIAAALVWVDQEETPTPAMLESQQAIPCSFVQLGLVQFIRSEEEVTALLRRKDLQLQHMEEQATYVKDHAWTVR